VWPWDARGGEVRIIKVPAAGAVAKTLHMFVYRKEEPMCCAQKV
jgi:hypothetical protein